MCGRVTLDVDIELLKELLEEAFSVKHITLPNYEPRYNIAPGQQVVSILNDGYENRAGYLRWGYIPTFAKSENEGYKHINARSETIDVKPTFKQSFVQKRCLVLANSFYEWHQDSPSKTPYRVLLKNQPLMGMAGIWSTYKKEDGQKLHTCSIMTTTANDLIKRIHHRMPVILDEAERNIWLNPKVTDVKLLKSLLRPYEPHLMTMYPVSKLVNNVKIDSEACIEAL